MNFRAWLEHHEQQNPPVLLSLEWMRFVGRCLMLHQALRWCFSCISFEPHNAPAKAGMIVSISQISNLRLTEGKSLGQNLTVNDNQSKKSLFFIRHVLSYVLHALHGLAAETALRL